MAWYGRRRSGEPRVGARAVVVGLGISMVGVLAIQTSSAVRSGIDASRTSMDSTAASLASFSAGVTGWQFGFGRSEEDASKISELEGRVRDLQRWKDLAETMALRMERYEKLLNLVGETQGQSVTARAVAEENGPFSASRIANAGAANGVRAGFAAVNENGLVGRVIRVGEYTARILLLTDSASRIPVMGTQSGDRAMLVGDSGNTAILTEAETPDRIVPGEVWVTSGDDGKLPLGIRVGTARKDGATWRIDLAMAGAPIDFVRLVPPPDFATPEVAPVLNEVQKNTDSSLRTVSAPLAPPAPTTTPATSGPNQAPPGNTTPRPAQAAPRPAPATPASTPDAPPAQSPAAQPGQGGGQ